MILNTLEPSWQRPRVAVIRRSTLLICLQSCHECALTCLGCADASIHENALGGLARCIGRDLDCAAVCAATEQVLARTGDRDRSAVNALLRACIEACRACADANSAQAGLPDRCWRCVEACRACEFACEAMLASEACA